jgi:hypothetical protein
VLLVSVCIIQSKSTDVNHPLQAIIVEIVLCSEAVPWEERIADDGIRCIVRIHLETLDFDLFEA